MHPTVILTRPKVQSERFAAHLDAAFGAPLTYLIAPLMEIVPVACDPVEQDCAHVVFTSVNGVDQAARLQVPKTAVAWCVGDQTTQAAQALGFPTRNAKGSSANLIAMIRDAAPTGPMVHLRGAHASGRVVETLAAAGCDIAGIVTYQQQELPPPAHLTEALKTSDSFIVPLFSPRSARIFSAVALPATPLHLVAISDATRREITKHPHDNVFLAPSPDQAGMISAIMMAIDALSPTNTP